MPKHPPISLLDKRANVQEQYTSDTTAWADLSDAHDAFRIRYSQGNLEGHEEVYRVSEHILVRTICSEVTHDDESSATNLAKHLTLVYKLRGVNTLVSADGTEVTLTPDTLMLGYSDQSERIKDRTPAGNSYAMVVVSIDPTALLRDPIALPQDSLPEVIADLITSKSAARKITERYTIDDRCKQCLTDLLNCPFQGPLRRTYLHAKVVELICLTLNILKGLDASRYNHSLNPKDREKLEDLRQQLNHNFRQVPAIADLAKQIGMSETKLKKSFKGLFGITIGDHLQQKRMQSALQLLRSQSGNVNQIANSLGYDHASNFITAFKRQFGLTPKAFQKQTFSED